MIREAVFSGGAEAFRHVDHERHHCKGVAESVLKFQVVEWLLAKPLYGSFELIVPEPLPHGALWHEDASPITVL